MSTLVHELKESNVDRNLWPWRGLQAVFFLVGAFITGALFFAPALGLHLLWNVLIPVAPALLIVAPGVWRNVCPMGTVSLLPRHLGLSKRRKIPEATQGWLAVGALALLLIIVPLRHVIFDTNGPAIGAALVAVAILAAGLGMVFEWKSAWCSGLCPVYPVELLYGQAPLISVRNAHCKACASCVSPCKDGTPELAPQSATPSNASRVSGLILAGGFPGFIWGWYQVPNWHGLEGFKNLHIAYGYPLGAMAVSLIVFVVLRGSLGKGWESMLVRVFAAAAASVYYWFKLPVMVGLGDPASALVNLSGLLPTWSAPLLGTLAAVAIVWAIVPAKRQAVWAMKPAAA